MDEVSIISTPPTIPNQTPNPNLGTLLVLSGAGVAALWFLNSFALPYMTMDPDRFGIYWPRRDWLFTHILGGTVALLLGPIQMWLGLSGGRMVLHRLLGIGYVMSVLASSVAAFYLAFHSDFGWVFGVGLTLLGVTWIITTGLAVAAVCRCLMQQHREWMIRSYVVTFAFVTFRLIVWIFQATGTGTTLEQLTAASWLCWSVPLFLTEAVLQSRKIFAARVAVEPKFTTLFSQKSVRQ